MKKFTAMLLAVLMAFGVFTGCGAKKDPAPTPSAEEKPAQTEAAEPEEKPEAEAEPEADTGEKPYEGVTIKFLIIADQYADAVKKVAALAEEKYGMKFEYEYRPGGPEGENIVKTRLASGEIPDIMNFNTGALFAALNPSEYFMDLKDQPFVEKYNETYKKCVTIDGAVYGVPQGTGDVGGVLYYKPDYEELGLEVPETWDEFLANCDALKEAGKTAIIGTLGGSWTAQLPFLGDHYNLLKQNPNFPQEFEAGTAKYATTPAGVASFQKIYDMQPYLNEDYAVATYDDGCEMLANGEATHWIILSGVLANLNSLYPENMNDYGFFAVPAEKAEDTGLTVWMPTSIYVNKNAENKDAIMAFLDLYLSEEGLDTFGSVCTAFGPYYVKGYEMPEDTCDAVKVDIQKYFDEGKTAAALEFETSVKGPNCPAICQEVLSRQITAEEAAAAYDADCEKQALQLGLDW